MEFDSHSGMRWVASACLLGVRVIWKNPNLAWHATMEICKSLGRYVGNSFYFCQNVLRCKPHNSFNVFRIWFHFGALGEFIWYSGVYLFVLLCLYLLSFMCACLMHSCPSCRIWIYVWCCKCTLFYPWWRSVQKIEKKIVMNWCLHDYRFYSNVLIWYCSQWARI